MVVLGTSNSDTFGGIAVPILRIPASFSLA